MISKEQTQAAFDKSTERIHFLTTLIGLSLNLVWFVSDLFVLPDYAKEFFVFRATVSISSMILLLLRKRLNVSIYVCMFVLVCGISTQNAYMWSVMDVANFQQHTFAYLALFVGVGMLVLWKTRFSLGVVLVSVAANAIFYTLNSKLTLNEFIVNGGLLMFTVVVFCIYLIRSRYRLTFSEIQLRLDLEESKEEIEEQKEDLLQKNREITDSINYARTIQQALLPSTAAMNEGLKDHFVLNLPKSIVSGDFYWMHTHEHLTFFAVGDCTGHGIPGGFMTMLGMSFLEEVVIAKQYINPAIILDELRDRFVSSLNQKGLAGESKDGMDISLCVINHTTMQLFVAAAYNDVYVVRKNEIHMLKAMRQPCGYSPAAKPFETLEFLLEKGDRIYCTTDGYADQFGGPAGKKYRIKNLLHDLLELNEQPMSTQRELLLKRFEDWRGELEQVDDVLLLGTQI